MKRIVLLLLTVIGISTVNAQSKFIVAPQGVISSSDSATFILVNAPELSKKQLIEKAYNILSTNNPYTTSTIEKKEDLIVITGNISGFTKTDKFKGSAYLFDFAYRITIEFKDGKLRILAPVFSLGNESSFINSSKTIAGTTNTSKQDFTLSMEICGKNDIWSNKHKKWFIYDLKHKLLEKGTKNKLETVFNSYVDLLQTKINASNEDW